MKRGAVVLRAAGALLVLAVAIVLARPAPARPSGLDFVTLLSPLAVGQEVARGYVLAPPRRGEEHDVVLSLARAEARIEIHVLPRGAWSGIGETPSFGVGYETQASSASHDDCEVLTARVRAVIARHDPGNLQPDALALEPGRAPPPASRALDRFAGARGVALGVALVVASWLLASLPGGAVWAALLLFLLGLALRLPDLGVPFVHDQDVQRLFTGHMPVTAILGGRGLEDRHPPLYFIVLHMAQWFGQSETVVRLPAAIAGALAGPAVVAASRVLARPVVPAALAGLAATLSAELVLRSREVSEIPLFGLLAIAMSVSLLAFVAAPSRRRGVAVALSHGLALWTYYLAPLYVIGGVAGLLALRKIDRSALRWLGLGVLLGAPAVVLGAVTIVRDHAARVAAAARPALAWGAHHPLEMAGHLGEVALAAFGAPLLVLVALSAVLALFRRDAAVIAPLSAVLATFAGIAAVVPFARAQPYYLVGVLPAAFLALGLGFARLRERALLAAIVAVFAVPRTHLARDVYVASEDAFMPRFVRVIAARPERRVATVAHFDATLLEYYLARSRNVPVDWGLVRSGPDGVVSIPGVDKHVVPLAFAHSLAEDPARRATGRLAALLRDGPLLVVEREEFDVHSVSARLRSCRLLDEVGSGRLFACAQAR